MFEQHDITGSKIWCMFKDLCDQKINTMIELLQMLQQQKLLLQQLMQQMLEFLEMQTLLT